MEKEHKKIGRPTKLTQELQEKICDYIAKGNYAVTACNAVGISESTFYNWLERAEEEERNGEGIYLEFMESIKRAEAIAEAEMVQKFATEANKPGNWLALATFLERRHPKRWGRKDRSILQIEDKKPITITQVEVILDRGAVESRQIIGVESRELPNKQIAEGETSVLHNLPEGEPNQA